MIRALASPPIERNKETVHPPPSGGTAEATSGEDHPAPWNDELAESAFLAEARDRGEPAVAKKAAPGAAEDNEPNGPLPPLDELVNQIPLEVRRVLEDLFRARFVTVKRVPRRALK